MWQQVWQQESLDVAARGFVCGRSVAARGFVCGRSVAARGFVCGRSVAARGFVCGRSVAARGFVCGRSVAATTVFWTCFFHTNVLNIMSHFDPNVSLPGYKLCTETLGHISPLCIKKIAASQGVHRKNGPPKTPSVSHDFWKRWEILTNIYHTNLHGFDFPKKKVGNEKNPCFGSQFH